MPNTTFDNNSTMNTIYMVIDEGNDELRDMGNNILDVFY